MAEDVALLHLYNGTVEEMQVGAADGAAGDFEDDIAVFDDNWAWNGLHFDRAFAHPAQGFHGLGRVAILGAVAGRVGNVLNTVLA